MTSKTKRRLKNLSLVLTGFIIGALFCYGFMWWQVYRKFETVWMCQIFVGSLSIEEAKYCDQYRERKANNDIKYY